MLKKNHHSRRASSHKESKALVIDIGSSFSVRELGTGELDLYTLVLPENADISRNRVSTLTPLGRAIFSRKAGDVVKYMAPGGLVKMRIESVQIEPVGDMTVEIP